MECSRKLQKKRIIRGRFKLKNFFLTSKNQLISGRSLAGFEGFNLARGMDVCLLWMLYALQEEASATG